mmetsp:Transcript_34217/g.89780  ORF Transcript_34217/g.89780 Transcript_34217/m.89780 type:complete len:332 (-) Transcript_34217:91-1086(-)
MATLKTAKAKSPEDLVVKTVAALHKAEGADKAKMQQLATFLLVIKNVLYGSAGAPANPDHLTQVATAAFKNNLILLMIENLEYVDFESKKDVVQIFNKLLRREVGPRNPTVDHIAKNKNIIRLLVEGYDKPQVHALSCGLMLRECIKKDELARLITEDEVLFYLFFKYVQNQQFDIAADAFASFKDLLTSHKILIANFLEKNYEPVMEQYGQLLKSENYVTRRQSLKLLGELLLDRANFTIMSKYIGDPENLKCMMDMLRDKSKNIQFEAFHVFKVFVANPSKSPAIKTILIRNKQKLIDFLTKFQESRSDDEQFAEEKKYLIGQIRDLEP